MVLTKKAEKMLCLNYLLVLPNESKKTADLCQSWRCASNLSGSAVRFCYVSQELVSSLFHFLNFDKSKKNTSINFDKSMHQIWQIQVTTERNPCINFDKSKLQIREIHETTLTNPAIQLTMRSELQKKAMIGLGSDKKKKVIFFYSL